MLADHMLFNAGKSGAVFMDFTDSYFVPGMLPNTTVDLVIAEFMPRISTFDDAFSNE